MKLTGMKRERVLPAAIGACLVTAIGVSSAFGQEATPSPSSGATQPATAERRASAAEKTALAEEIQRVTDTIALVQQDRDALAGTTDLAAVDDLLAKAASLRDGAKTVLAGDDLSTAPGLVLAAHELALAAENLLRAGLDDHGLPSQQAGASRTLVSAYNLIDEITADAAANGETGAESADLIATAQRLYATAYDLYNAGTYAQAAGTAEVAARVGLAARLLNGGAFISGPGPDALLVTPPMDGEQGAWSGFAEGVPDGSFVVEGWPEEIGILEIRPGAGGDEIRAGGGAIAIERFAGADGWMTAGGDDFSDETPLDVPAPDFSQDE